jgi:UDP-N-acetylmuramoyl-L-alanine---L-glutamate ligase
MSSRWSDLTGRNVIVWGARLEGKAAVNSLRNIAQVRVVVDPPAQGDQPDYAALTEELGVPVSAPTAEVLAWATAIVRSPIIHPDRTELAAARAAGKVVGHPVGLWFADARMQPVIGVTGTKGKSTTSSLTTQILTQAGLRVGLGGNIEIPITDLADDLEVYVVEVSSYMATDVEVSPRFGILTNLGEDHVTWHGSLARYHADKMRVFAHPELEMLAVNGLDPRSMTATARLPRTLYGSNGYVVDNRLCVRLDSDLIVDLRGTPLGNAHFALDVCAALTGASFVVGIEAAAEAIGATVESYETLPCRLEFVGVVGGVEFIDDALASNPFGAAAGIAAYPDRPVAVILGGEDRDVSFDPIVDTLAARSEPTVAVLISDTTEMLASKLRAAHVEVIVIGGQEVAPATQAAAAAAARWDNAVVLFSPGAPTPRWFGYHTDRSRAFKSEVAALTAVADAAARPNNA